MIRLSSAFLSSKAPDLRYCHPSNAHLRQSPLNSLELEGFDDGFDLFHLLFHGALTVPVCLDQVPTHAVASLSNVELITALLSCNGQLALSAFSCGFSTGWFRC